MPNIMVRHCDETARDALKRMGQALAIRTPDLAGVEGFAGYSVLQILDV